MPLAFLFRGHPFRHLDQRSICPNCSKSCIPLVWMPSQMILNLMSQHAQRTMFDLDLWLRDINCFIANNRVQSLHHSHLSVCLSAISHECQFSTNLTGIAERIRYLIYLFLLLIFTALSHRNDISVRTLSRMFK